MDENIKTVDVSVAHDWEPAVEPIVETAVDTEPGNLRHIYKTLVYPTAALESWNWESNLGLRVRILQVVSYVLGQDAIIFVKHNPLKKAKTEGYTQINLILDFVQEIDNGIDA